MLKFVASSSSLSSFASGNGSGVNVITSSLAFWTLLTALKYLKYTLEFKLKVPVKLD